MQFESVKDQAAEYGIAAHKISRHLAKGAPKLRNWSLTKIFAP